MNTYKQPIGDLKPNQHIVYGATAQRRIRETFTLAKHCPNDEFIIPYTAAQIDIPGVGTAEDLAQLFAEQYRERPNLLFEESFAELVKAKLTKQHTI